ncbi:MAG: hypothetical protein ACRD0A_02750 [Acidimicrobiales bacterium]
MAAFVISSLAGVLAPSAPAAADDDGLRFESHTVYRLDPVADAVQVTVAVTVTHEVPDAPDGSFYFFDELWLGVPAEAINLTATRGDGQPAPAALEPIDVPAWSQATIDLVPDLRFGQTRSLTVAFTLPGLPPRSEGLTRVNDAVATFAVVAHGDPGLASVDVILPTSYRNDLVGAEMTSRTVGEQIVYSATEIADPGAWGVSVASRNEAALVDTRVDVAGRAFDVRAWPGDAAWSDFVARQLQVGLPVLEDLVGLPWPAPADGLDLTESVTPDAHGFDGWYDSSRNAIEIGDELDPHLVFHELSHLWFNGELFSQRWIVEGLAEEYGARVVAALGNPPPTPQAFGADHPGAVRLNAWGDTTVARDELTVQRELFAYNTSWSVIRSVSDEIGMDAMGAVVAAAADDRIAYQGDPEPEAFDGPSDWTRFVDLLEEVGGSAQASSLFASTVLTPEQLPLLDARAAARTSYDQLEAAGGEWTPPLAVREAMATWDFERAAELTTAASAVLTVRDQIAATVRPLGLDAPDELEAAYESGQGRLSELDGTADRTLDAAQRLAAADAAVGNERGVLATIGLWWSDVDAAVDEAADAFVDGDADTTIERADDAERLVAGAARTGGMRAGALAAGAAVVVVATLGVRRSRRRRVLRRTASAATIPPPPSLAASAAPITPPPQVDWPTAPPPSDDPPP